MSELLRVGLAGCGVITQRTLRGVKAILGERRAVVAALCDPNSNNLDIVGDSIGSEENVARFVSFEEMIAASCCDAVVMATPIGLHFGQARLALENGLHVYSHKTLARTRAECAQLDELATRQDLRLAASPGQLLLPAYRRAAELLEQNKLGRIASVDAAAEAAPHRYEAERADESPPAGRPFSWEWYHRRESGGGPLDDMFVYPLAFLTGVFGGLDDASVFAELITPRIEWRDRVVTATAFDSYCGVVRFRDVTATIRSSFSSNTQLIPWGTIVIRGSDAALEIVKHNDLEYSLFITPNSGPALTESHPVFDGDARRRYGDKECHVLVDICEFVDAINERRAVRGATAANAAKVTGALRMIEERAAAHAGVGHKN